MMPPGLSTAENAQREEGGTSAVKRIILVVTVAAMTVAMTTLGVAGLAMAQAPSPEELDLPSAEDLSRSIGFYPDPDVPGCWFAPGGMYVCAE